MTTATARDVRLHDGASDSVRAVHELFVETLGEEAVEDLTSFHLTVSPHTDAEVAPKLVTTHEDDHLVGAMLGVYLRRLNGSIILYAGVKESFRRRGLYTEMRNTLMSELAAESQTGPRFVLSEQDQSSWLFTKYLHEWGAFVAPLDYVQPAVQGLPRRRLDLVVIPQGASRQDIIKALPTIVRELYASVYRISVPEEDPDCRHIIDSIGAL